MKILFPILFISLFIFSCDVDNPTTPIDECGVPNGDGVDDDEDGICDDVDDCVGEVDDCGVCNGENLTLDECGICDGSGLDCGGGCNENVELWNECYNIQDTYILDLQNLNLSGEIPSQIGDLINLTQLNLRDNNLSGVIPYQIGQLTNLIRLELYENNLSGEIPSQIGNLINLNILFLYQNQLSGIIPDELCDIEGLFIDLSDNRLCPPYPRCIEQYIIE